ncbi:Ig-like domain-containing protein [Arthrobacter sp. ZBG10]|uniref:Ig-like domain-containing protein n=1 Tax=Arthrobacter sp. ZBG10 TaxID=1676590 RepID=UPI000A61B752|nr:Ig-like domain-containing protein [Arthrobacter sp. ZBG10]
MENSSKSTAPAAARSLRYRISPVLSLMAAAIIACAGFAAPAQAAGTAGTYTTGRSEVGLVAYESDLAFANNSIQVVAWVSSALPSTKVPSGTVSLLSDTTGKVLSVGDVNTDEPFLGVTFMDSPALSLGANYFKAAYSGDANFSPKTIRFAIQGISGPKTQTAITVSPAGSSVAGLPITITARTTALPSGPLTGRPVGEYILEIDGVEVDYHYIGAGWQYVFTVTNLPAGQHMFTVRYVDQLGNYGSSTSAPVTYTVTPALGAVKTEFHSSHHGDIPAGTAVTVQAVIKPGVVGGATPSGWVQFYDWNTKVGSPVKLVNGKAGYTHSTLKYGKHVLQARYLGSSSYMAVFTPARTVIIGS